MSGSKSDNFRHIYMLEDIEKQTIQCERMDDLLAILNNKYLLLWMDDLNYDSKVQIIKLDKPDEVLYECDVPPNTLWQPILLDFDKNISSSIEIESKRFLFWRGEYDTRMCCLR